ncbi:MAG: mycofactocin biosynthesis chaperone MftB [Thermodesulfobacteriota bacterium]
MGEGKKYRLAPGTQVREEDFGLLFYTMQGPRLYFLKCGPLLETDFFQGDMTLSDWTSLRGLSRTDGLRLAGPLAELQAKGVIREC